MSTDKIDVFIAMRTRALWGYQRAKHDILPMGHPSVPSRRYLSFIDHKNQGNVSGIVKQTSDNLLASKLNRVKWGNKAVNGHIGDCNTARNLRRSVVITIDAIE